MGYWGPCDFLMCQLFEVSVQPSHSIERDRSNEKGKDADFFRPIDNQAGSEKKLKRNWKLISIIWYIIQVVIFLN